MSNARMSKEEAKVIKVMGNDSYQNLCECAFETAYLQAKYYISGVTSRGFDALVRKTRKGLFKDVYNRIMNGELNSNHRITATTTEQVLEKLAQEFGYNGATRLQRILAQKEHARRGNDGANS